MRHVMKIFAPVFFALSIVACVTAKAPSGSPSNASHTRHWNNNLSHVEEVKGQSKTVCGENSVLVEGDFCPRVEEICLKWVGNASSETGKCAEWKQPTKCLTPVSKRIHMRYCIDAYEWPNIVGQKPKSWLNWYDAKREVEASGKRLCTDKEWTMACEGAELQPYPFGTGYVRDKIACNIDNVVPTGLNVFDAKKSNDITALRLDALLVAAGSMKGCVSPVGVHDMSGNIDEWVVNGSKKPYISALKGGHIFGVRNVCRPSTIAHAPEFSWYETGTRACHDIK